LISAILFDLGNTLIEETSDALNTERGYYELQVRAIHKSLGKDGVSVEWSSFMKRYEQVRRKQIETSRITLREYDMRQRVSDTLSFFEHDVSVASDIISRALDAYMDLYVRSLKIKEPVHGILKHLADEYRLGLVTNFAYSPGTYRILEQFALRPFFDAVIISGEVGWKKPSQRIFEIALSRLSSKAEETVFVGDDYEADIAGAKNVGMKTVFLSKKPTIKEKADATIESLEELTSTIQLLRRGEL
jgi:putative hydrolase of the HAD superfamily